MPSMFYFRPIFMLALFVGEAIFAVKLKRRKNFLPRLLVSMVCCFLASLLIPYQIDNGLYYAFMFIVLFALTVIAGKFCFDEPLKNILFCSIAGYTTQHIASEFCEIFNAVMSSYSNMHFDIYDVYKPATVDSGNLFMITMYVIIYLWVYWAVWKYIAPKIDKYKVMKVNSMTILVLSLSVLLIDIIIGAFVIFLFPQEVLVSLGRTLSFLLQLILHGYNIICCGFIIVLIIELPRRTGMEAELRVVRQINHKKREQYEVAKETIDLINMKCHDLRHQTSKLLRDKVDEKDIEDINNIVDIYECNFTTKSNALNVVLTEKNLLCKRENISLSVIADAARLSFMKDSDIYVLFGNIMDNAMEAVKKVEGERIIGVNIQTVNQNFLVINVYNRYVGEIELADNLPVTTKKDTRWHGYGLKSIQYTVEKYGGEMAIKTNDGIFTLSIIFPLNEGSGSTNR